MSSVVSLSSYDYAAGTWALRLTGQVSPLTALTDRVVLKRLRFQLSLWEDLGNPAPFHGDGSREPFARSAPAFEISGHGSDLADLSHLVQTYVQQYLQEQGLTPSQGLSQGQHSLTPMGLTRHRLTVAGLSSPVVVNLSLVQLADLATVLGQAEQAVEQVPEELALPQRQPSRSKRPSRLPLWTGSVAAVLVAAVLGSQWLGQSPPTLVQSPTPTAETLTPDASAGGSESTTEGSASLNATENATELDNDTALDPGATLGERSETQGLSGSPGSEATSDTAPSSASSTAPSTAHRSPNAAPEVASTETDRATPPQPHTEPDNLAAVPPRAATPFSVEQPLPSASPPPAGSMGERSRTPASVPSATPEASDSLAPASSAPEAAPELAPAPLGTHLADSAPVDDLEPLRRALAENWSPRPGLSSPLRYRLTLGPTGEVLVITPLTAPSRPYLAPDDLPQVGDVIPNLRLSEPTTVDIELLPSGIVNVYRSSLP